MGYAVYTVLTSTLFLSLFPFFWVYTRITGKHRFGLKQRLGIYGRELDALTGAPRIWMHAASVGEVRVAEALLAPLRDTFPGCSILVSTITEKGYYFARERLGEDCVCVLAPLDFIFSVKKAIATVRPDIYICLETELWPNMLRQSRKSGAATVILNGRLSVHTVNRYRRLKPFMTTVLKNVDAFSMISNEDARRIRAIGAPAERVQVNGNAKYDLLAQSFSVAVRDKMAALFHVTRNEPVWVAGSTRHDEERIIADVYERLLGHYPDMVLIVVPRHVERVPGILRMFSERRLSCQLRTAFAGPGECRSQPVVVVDTMGELQDIYSLATVAFCGGSLVNCGGQNPLEAALWGCPVLHGPSMENFDDARTLLEQAGGSVPVADGDDLYRQIVSLMSHPEKRDQIGAAAREAVLSTSRAAARHVKCLRDFIS